MPSASPTQPSDIAFVGGIVFLAALFLFVLGACVPVTACIYCRSRRSKLTTYR